jgi:hypothetical protein
MSIPPWFGVKQTQEVFYMIRAIGGDGRKNGEKITHRFRQGGCRGAVSYISKISDVHPLVGKKK